MHDTDIDWVLTFLSREKILFSYFLRFHFFKISFFLILFISWQYVTLILTRFWHYVTLTLARCWNCLTLILIEFWKFFLFIFFFFLICFSIWKKIKESDKKLNKRIYCSLSKQWLIHQQLLNYCIGTSKIYKKFDFKGKPSHLEERLFNSASGLFMQKYIIIWIVCIFL